MDLIDSSMKGMSTLYVALKEKCYCQNKQVLNPIDRLGLGTMEHLKTNKGQVVLIQKRDREARYTAFIPEVYRDYSLSLPHNSILVHNKGWNTAWDRSSKTLTAQERHWNQTRQTLNDKSHKKAFRDLTHSLTKL